MREIVGVALEGECFDLEEVARVCAVEREWIVTRVEAGLLPALPGSPVEWRFTATTVQRVRRMRQVERDFDALPELAALFADVLDEMDAMRARLRVLEGR